jgi:Domain of unknown function (DUF4430)
MSTGDTVSLKVTVLDTDIVAIDVPWTSGMNAKELLEAAYDTGQDPGYEFSLAYYGSDLGYMVEEFEQIGDQLNLYWQFLVNGQWSPRGIDQVSLEAGDAVLFRYSYVPDDQATSQPPLAAKHSRRARARRA